MKGIEREIGVFMGGGKGAASRKTPEQIRGYADTLSLDPEPLVYASKMSAKVDSTAVQDGYQLYHHVFIFTLGAEWTVIQQGMNEENRTARRYHWLGSSVKDFVVEPHRAICCDVRNVTLNMVAQESVEARQITTVLAREKPEKVVREIERIQKLEMPRRHTISDVDIDPRKMRRTLLKAYESQPENFEKLLGVQGVGAKTIRALSLISEMIYGKAPSFRDPARFSFAHGGKDGTPFPVDKRTYDKTINVMRKAINTSKIGNQDKVDAVRKLSLYYRD